MLNLKLKYDILLSTFAFKFNLRRYTMAVDLGAARAAVLLLEQVNPQRSLLATTSNAL